MNRFFYPLMTLFLGLNCLSQAQTAVYLDTSKTLEVRVNDLVSKLSLEEKVMQMNHRSPAVPRLNIPAYNWWNEALHGVGRSGVATIFPQAIGLGASFDEDLALRVSSAISDEARAMYNAAIAKGHYQQYAGLTFWTPNINIFRDPRWGRGQETYGEDPYLTARLGVAFVKGLQGDNPKYLKTAGCAKHFAVHSGPERLRHEFNATATPKDLRETYLPAFKALVTEAHVEAVMCAYNRTNGAPCCANNFLLTEVLRKEWGFKGHVVSDCWAVKDFYEGHKTVDNQMEAAAMAVKRGVELNCGDEFPALVDAVKNKLIEKKEIDQALAILLRTRFRLGMFDPKDSNPYNAISTDVINNAEHRALAREAAVKSMVLLKNNGVLPLKNDLARYFVTGPNAGNVDALIGNYYGVNSNIVTILEGLAGGIQVGSQLNYKAGILLNRDNENPIDWTTGEAKGSAATFVVMGITGFLEGEEGESISSPSYGDRLDYNLPQNQINFLKKIRETTQNPVIAIVTGGSPMNLAEVHELADAVLLVWYPGEEGGNAVADVVFGKTSPSGRLPLTFPKSLDQLPPYESYAMKGRTYRFMQQEPMYPFGYGLSYTKFVYDAIKTSNATVSLKDKASIAVEVRVTNVGTVESEEVVQMYLTDMESSVPAPLFSLKGMKRVKLRPSESIMLKFTITPEMMMLVNDKGESVLEPGKFKVSIGGALPSARSEVLGAAKPAELIFTLK